MASYDQEISNTTRQLNQTNSVINDIEGKIAAIQVKIEQKISIYLDESARKRAYGQPAVVSLTRELNSYSKSLKEYKNQKNSFEKILGGLQTVKQKAKQQQDEVERNRRRSEALLERQRRGAVNPYNSSLPEEASNVQLSEASQNRLAASRGRRKPAPRRAR